VNLSKVKSTIFIINLLSLLYGEKTEINIYNLKINEYFEIDSIIIEVKNAFEGSKINYKIEKFIFDIGNSIHTNTKISVIKNLLLFKPKDLVNKDMLIESEINLRKKNFLADANITLIKTKTNKYYARIIAFDQWSTIPGSGIKRVGNQLSYWAGISEKNFLGTGQTISLSYHKKLRTNGYTFNYKHPGFKKNRIQFITYYTNNNEGYNIELLLKKPLISKTQKFGFLINHIEAKKSMWSYLDGNYFNYNDHKNFNIETTNILAKFEDIYNKSTKIELIKSYGINNKFNISTFIQSYYQKHKGNTLIYNNNIEEDLIVKNRNEASLGFSISLDSQEYHRIKNLTNLKWYENFIDTKKILIAFGKNLKTLGSNNDDFMIYLQMLYTNSFNSKYFLSAKASTNYFTDLKNNKRDGESSFKLNFITKINNNLNFYFSTENFNNLNKIASEKLFLGESNGLLGYPNFYFTGHSSFLLTNEMIYMPNIEVFTIIPAFAIFTSSGNTFEKQNHINFNDLNSSIGIGLRLGLSKSSEKIISHFNISWPLNSVINGPIFSIKSKKHI